MNTALDPDCRLLALAPHPFRCVACPAAQLLVCTSSSYEHPDAGKPPRVSSEPVIRSNRTRQVGPLQLLGASARGPVESPAARTRGARARCPHAPTEKRRGYGGRPPTVPVRRESACVLLPVTRVHRSNVEALKDDPGHPRVPYSLAPGADKFGGVSVCRQDSGFSPASA